MKVQQRLLALLVGLLFAAVPTAHAQNAATANVAESAIASSIASTGAEPPTPLGVLPSIDPSVPLAAKHPKPVRAHGHTRVDDYFWLRNQDDPVVLDHLKAENAYAEATLAPLDVLKTQILDEIVGRINPKSISLLKEKNGSFYYERYEEGAEYPIFARRKGSPDGPEEVLLDVNRLAEGHDFIKVQIRDLNPAQTILPYTVDATEEELHTIYFKDVATGERLDDVLPNTTGMMAWANDNRTVFYTRPDLDTKRPYRLYRHVLGTPVADDVLVYEESDPAKRVSVSRTRSGEFLLLGINAKEARVLRADDPRGDFDVIAPRREGVDYLVHHYGDRFYFVTNEDAPNFRVMTAPVDRYGREHWTELIPHRDDVVIESVHVFDDHLVVGEVEEGLLRIRVQPWGEAPHYVTFEDDAYYAYVDASSFESTTIRYGYFSLTTPRTIYDYDVATRTSTLVKQTEVPGGFSSDDYVTGRTYATADDGTRVPISYVAHKDTPLDGTAPTLLYGYGAYGWSTTPVYSNPLISLLDRGFVYAIGHIRGGFEGGRRWYDQGKRFQKMNTFTDFIACAEHLVDARFADPDRMFAIGLSAGGMVTGATMNMRPDLFRGVVNVSPFVDVVNTMLDESLPLTVEEYGEWGNMHEPDVYHYMLQYSPYDNVVTQSYPDVLAFTGLNDAQVGYWEATKWIAKLREHNTGASRALLNVDMGSGHGGSTGRYAQHERWALIYAYLVDLAAPDRRAGDR